MLNRFLQLCRSAAQRSPLFRSPAPIRSQPVAVFEGQLLAGQKALVTGAGGRVGEALVAGLLQQQAAVWFSDINTERVREIERSCPPATGMVMDIRETDEMIARLDAQGFIPDLLINNVGISIEKPFLEETNSDWESVFQTNLFAPLRLTQAVAQRMIAHNLTGSILFISSVHQAIPSTWPSYSASKAALQMTVKELAIEFAPHNIRVNAIAPGWVDRTPQHHHRALLGRQTIDPNYIAHAVVFLGCHALSRCTTGAMLTVDAGMSLYGGRVK
jgi:NAD(P)-dependent dehydrogenase (short-subunit alcohol dehydrogenase family)